MMKIGILGGGQLALMLMQAGQALDLECIALADSPDCPASLAGQVIVGDYQHPEQLADFVQRVDVLTFENENINTAPLHDLTLYPNLHALAISQDRLLEKNYLNDLNIPTAPYSAVDSLAELQHNAEQQQHKGILKTRTQGYDGKGQYRINTPSDIPAAWQCLGSYPVIFEGLVNFDCEVSQIAVRDRHGNCAFYPLCHNTHHQGILYRTLAPYDDAKLSAQAQRYAQQLLNALDYVGVLCIEFFVCAGRLLANEIAPRVHNSGHWTIEGCQTSQFSNHLRAIAELPLGSTEAQGMSAMLNCIGYEPKQDEILISPDIHFHSYGKRARPARKLAHITVNCTDPDTRMQLLQTLEPKLNNC